MATAEAIQAYADARARAGLPNELSHSAVARIANLFGREPEEAAPTGTTTNPLKAASRVGGPFVDHPTASAS